MPSKNAPFPYAGGYVDFPLDGYNPMYVEQWNFGIQHQFGTWMVTANYLGNHTVHMISSQGANPAVFLGTGPCTLTTLSSSGTLVQTPYSTCSTTANQNFRRKLFLQNPANGAYFAGIGQELDSGTASYNGLVLSASHALSRGLALNTNFTWSHCISDQYDQQTGQSGAGVSIPDNLAAYRGSCSPQDVRFSWIFNGVYTTPKLANRIASTLLSDWQIAPIIQIRSGQALNVTSGLDQALTTVGRSDAPAGFKGPVLRGQELQLLAESGRVRAAGARHLQPGPYLRFGVRPAAVPGERGSVADLQAA